jgi:hypothetical protein
MTSDFRWIRPAADEYDPHYSGYISRVPDGDIIETMKSETTALLASLRAIPASRADYSYAPGKWTIRQIVGHLCDAERVFAYRAMRFARADRTPVPGFEENDYVDNAPFQRVPLADLIDELAHLRAATVRFFETLDAESMSRRGIANNAEISVRAIAYIMPGHSSHHIGVLKSRYLDEATQPAGS